MTEFFQDSLPVTTSLPDFTGEEEFYQDALPVILVDVNGNAVGYLSYVGTSDEPVSDADTDRPEVTGPVYWLCDTGITPINALPGDLISSDGVLTVAS